MYDPKSEPRINDPSLLKYLKITYDCCEITYATSRTALHHVIFRSHGGDDVRENIVNLVEPLHVGIHAGCAAEKLQLAVHIRDNRHDVAEYIKRKLGGETQLLAWYERHGLKGVVNGT